MEYAIASDQMSDLSDENILKKNRLTNIARLLLLCIFG